MRSTSFATLGALALIAAGTAFAQQVVSADIPFEFTFANKVLPAGYYDLTHRPGVLLVRNVVTKAAAFSTVINIGKDASGSGQSGLAFNKYGDKYFLAEAWSSTGAEWGSGVIQSKAERELARINPDVARVTIPARTGSGSLVLSR